MWLQIVIIFSIHYFASARQNYSDNKLCFSDNDCGGFTCDLEYGCTRTPVAKTYWKTDICYSNSDCRGGLTSCHRSFRCTISFVKTAIVVLSIFISLCLISCVLKWVIMRSWRKRHCVPHSPVMPTNQTLWNHYAMRTTTKVYLQTSLSHPQYFNQQQPVADDDPPSYTECQISVCPSPPAEGALDNEPSYGHPSKNNE